MRSSAKRAAPKRKARRRGKKKTHELVLPKFEVLADGAHALTIPVHTECFVNGSQGFSKGATFAAGRAKKAQRETTAQYLFGIGISFRDVHMVRIAPSDGLDDGNLWNALKGVQDELAAHLSINDGPKSPATWSVANERGEAYGVRVELRMERRPDWKGLRDAIARVLRVCAENETVAASEVLAAIRGAA